MQSLPAHDAPLLPQFPALLQGHGGTGCANGRTLPGQTAAWMACGLHGDTQSYQGSQPVFPGRAEPISCLPAEWSRAEPRQFLPRITKQPQLFSQQQLQAQYSQTACVLATQLAKRAAQPPRMLQEGSYRRPQTSICSPHASDDNSLHCVM